MINVYARVRREGASGSLDIMPLHNNKSVVWDCGTNAGPLSLLLRISIAD